MKYNSNSQRRFGTRQLTVVGMLSAISVILGLTGYGFIPLPGIKATIMHIPVIIGTIIEGPMVGMLIGLIFGLFSIIQNIMAPAILSFAMINPLVSVVPRVLIAITTYFAYKYMVGNKTIKIGVAAAVGTITNTVGVLTMIYLLYAARYAEQVLHKPKALVAKVIYGIAVMNGIPEVIAAVIIVIPVVLALKKIIK